MAEIYYELSWAILSTIGLLLTLLGVLVICITNLTRLTMVPVVTSAACAVANGLCYCAFYSERPIPQQIAAAVVADVMWMIQDAGLSFYSYFLLNGLLKHTSRRVFLIAFWILMGCILAMRLSIMVTRVKTIKTSSEDEQKLNLKLHFGYFTSIALVEILSAYYLLRIFSSSTLKNSPIRAIFRRLTMSTEIRLATLSIIGVSRAVLYAFRDTEQTANNVPTEIDRFVYTVECMFPVAMMIDILAAKLSAAQSQQGGSSNNRARASLHSSLPGLGISRRRDRDRELDCLYSIEDGFPSPPPSCADNKNASRVFECK